MAVVDEKASSPLAFLTDNVIAETIQDYSNSLSVKRKQLGLTNPGTVDAINAEVTRDVLLTNYQFQGLRCDMQKMFSMTPLFRVQHGFAIGSPSLPPYQLLAIYGTSKIFMQGSLSSDKSLAAWFNYRWTESFTTKLQAQFSAGAGQTLVTFDNDYTGDDFSASIKTVTPSILEGGLTGVVIGSYLQSLTPSMALGFEGVWQRQGMNSRPETMMSYSARYKGHDWIASAQYLAQGAISTSYWRRLTDKVDVGAEFQLQFMPGLGGGVMGMRKEGATQVGAKYSFLQSTLRTQLDSAGKLSVNWEKRVLPPVSFTTAFEYDYVKDSHKIGLAVSFENATEELQQAMEQADAGDASPPPF